MKQYSYDGPVMEFERCIVNHWQALTYAVSESKARSNLAYKFKKQNGKACGAKISLPGKIISIEEKEKENGRV